MYVTLSCCIVAFSCTIWQTQEVMPFVSLGNKSEKYLASKGTNLHWPIDENLSGNKALHHSRPGSNDSTLNRDPELVPHHQMQFGVLPRMLLLLKWGWVSLPSTEDSLGLFSTPLKRQLYGYTYSYTCTHTYVYIYIYIYTYLYMYILSFTDTVSLYHNFTVWLDQQDQNLADFMSVRYLTPVPLSFST